MYRRFFTVAARLLILAAAVLIVPACKKNEDTSPHITKGTPDFDTLGNAHFPLMILEWDRALDPATIPNNIELWTANASGVPQGEWGQPYTVEYIPGTFQTIIKNGVAMGDASAVTYWAIIVFPSLTSEKGVAVNAHPLGSIALRFQVGTNANVSQPAPSTPAQVAGGGVGEIVFNWTQATEGGNPIANETYTFYGATTTGDQDFFDATPHLVVTDAGAGTVTNLTPGAVYHFRVVVRDSAGNTAIIGEFTGTANAP